MVTSVEHLLVIARDKDLNVGELLHVCYEVKCCCSMPCGVYEPLYLGFLGFLVCNGVTICLVLVMDRKNVV